jgi:hypothetical protein
LARTAMLFIDVATPVLLMNGYYGMGGYVT